MLKKSILGFFNHVLAELNPAKPHKLLDFSSLAIWQSIRGLPGRPVRSVFLAEELFYLLAAPLRAARPSAYAGLGGDLSKTPGAVLYGVHDPPYPYPHADAARLQALDGERLFLGRCFLPRFSHGLERFGPFLSWPLWMRPSCGRPRRR